MSGSENTEVKIIPEEDDVHAVAAKLGVRNYQERDKITPTEKQLQIINYELDDDGNSLLIRFTKLGKTDAVELLLKFDGINVDHENKNYETAAEIAKEENQFGCLLKLLEADALFPADLDQDEIENDELKEFLLKREKLHEYIEVGNLQGVKDALRDTNPSMYLSIENESALSHAARCEKIEIFAHLLKIRAKFKDDSEEEDCYFSDYLKEKLNDILQDQFLKIDNYDVLRLFYRSKSPQALVGSKCDILKSIYDYLGKSKVLRLLFKVLEYVDVDIVFDFESVHTNNMYCMNNRDIYGLTDTAMKRIFIGAKKCLSTDGVCKEVAGTLAHELCHMAMQVLYRNDAKPYAVGEETRTIGESYKCMVHEMHDTIKDSDKSIDDIIQTVYSGYPEEEWECELIVRVPHILAGYGEKEGKEILQKQAKDLYDFYMSQVVEDSKGFCDPRFFKKALCSIEYLHAYHGCISEADKERSPFISNLKSVMSYMVKNGQVYLLKSNMVNLCEIHIYHEKKNSYQYQMDKTCLFFRLEVFQKHEKEILKAFKSDVCRLMVIICKENLLDIDSISKYFSDVDLENGGKEVILVVGKNCEIVSKRKKKEKKTLEYLWKDFSKKYKTELMQRIINIKGLETELENVIKVEHLAKIVESDDMVRIIEEETLMIGDGRKDDWKGYRSYYYVERDLAKVTVDISFFQNLPDKTVLYITGLRKDQFSMLEIDENQCEWLSDSKEVSVDRKRIFIRETKGEGTFSEEFDGLYGGTRHWLHYSEGRFHVVSMRGIEDGIKKYLLRTDYSELELMEEPSNRIVLISDDPGTGKSTLLSSIIRKIMEYFPNNWVARINLLEYALDEENLLSLERINDESATDEVLELFLRMCGLKSNLDVCLMKRIISKDYRRFGKQCKVFLDGYDEVSSLYRDNLLKLFRTLVEATTVQLWITTRVHERIDLEMELGTCSLSLVQFTHCNKITFLDRMWKHSLFVSENIKSESEFSEAKRKLKVKVHSILMENKDNTDPLFVDLKKVITEVEEDSGDETWDEELQKLRDLIEGLKFTRFADYLIRRSSIKDEEIKFTGIPLHLFLVGTVAFAKNLRADIYSDLYGLYTEFVKEKVEIYWKEKEKNIINSVMKRKEYERLKKEIFNLHIGLARIIINGGKSRTISKNEVKENDLGVAVGILTKSGEKFQFIHRTFAEYFFAEWILLNMHGKILMEVMFDDRYNLVRNFLSSAVDRKEKKIEMTESSFKKFKVEAFFRTFAKKPLARDSSAVKLFRKILQAFEDVCSDKSMDDFILNFAKFIYQQPYADHVKTFWFLRNCLTGRMFSDLFGKHATITFKPISIVIRYSTDEDIRKIFEELENAFQSKSDDEDEYERSSSDEETCSNKSDDDAGSKLIRKFVRCRDKSGYGILHLAARNANVNVFNVVFGFLERVLNEEELRRSVLETTRDGSNILHCSVMRIGLKMNLHDIWSSIEGKVSLIDLLTGKDGSGRNVLHVAAENLQSAAFCCLLDFIHDVDHGVTLKKLLLQGDGNEKSILHYMCEFRGGYKVDEMLQKLKCFLGEEELWALMKRRDSSGKNIFHVLSMGANLDDIPLLEKNFDNDELRGLLLQVDNEGNCCLRLTLRFLELDAVDLIKNIKTFTNIVGPESLKEVLLTGNNAGKTFFCCLQESFGLSVDYGDYIVKLREYFLEMSLPELLNELPT